MNTALKDWLKKGFRKACGQVGLSAAVLVLLSNSLVALAPVASAQTVGGSYNNPLRDIKNLTPQRLDQGVDYGGSGPVYAVGPGKINYIKYMSDPGWPPNPGTFINYTLASGPAAGKSIYFAENCVAPAKPLQLNDPVDSNTVICNMVDASPHIETGWSVAGAGLALAYGAYDEGEVTALGANFSNFLVALGAPPGTSDPSLVADTLPAGWPTSWANVTPSQDGGQDVCGPTNSSTISIYQQSYYPFYDAGGDNAACCAATPVSGETGTGPLMGLQMPAVDPVALAKSIDDYIANKSGVPNSPLAGLGDKFVAAGQHFNVNPAMLVGIAYKESTLGTYTGSIVTRGHNSFGAFGNWPNQERQYPTFEDSGGSTVPIYDSFEQSPFGIADYISAGWLKPDSPKHATSVLELMKNGYTPGTTPENYNGQTLPHYQVAALITVDVMHKILDGISSTAPSSTSSNVSHVFPVPKGSTGFSDDWGSSRPQGTGGGGAWENAHLGNDIFAPRGTPVVAVTDGTVKAIGQTDLGGNRLWLKSDDGNSYYYAHLDSYAKSLGAPGKNTIDPRLKVKAGDVLGYVGNTGADGSDYHLHFSASHISLPDGPLKFVKNNHGSYDFFDQSGKSVEPYVVPTEPPPAKDGPGLFDPYQYLKDWEGGTNSSPAAGGGQSFSPGASSESQCQSSGSYQAGANGYDLTGPNAMAHFYQCDPKWAKKPYGSGGTICDTGCGIASLAMVVNTLAGANETPETLGKKYGKYNQGGTVWGLWPDAAKDYKLKEQNLNMDFAQAAATIRQGGLVILSVKGKGIFTDDSHLLVLRAVDNQGNFYIADPGQNADENKGYSVDEIINQGHAIGIFGFWR